MKKTITLIFLFIQLVLNAQYAPTAIAVSPIQCNTPTDLTATGLAPSVEVINFTGVANSCVEVPYDASYQLVNSSTIEMWVNPTVTTGGNIIYNKENSYEAEIRDGVLRWAYRTTSPGWVWVSTGVTIPLNTWTHIAIVRDFGADEIRTYVNGILVHTGVVTGTVSTAYNNPLRIGERSLAATSPYDGAIEQVRVWGVARTAAQILANMNYDVPSSSTNLIAAYNLNGNALASPGINGTILGTSHSYSVPTFYTYTWSGTGAPVASTAETQTTSAITATETYTVVASPSSGTSSIVSNSVEVNINMPVATADVSGNFVCAGSTIDLTASGLAPGGGLSGVAVGNTTSNITISNSADLQITGDQTIEMWVKPNSFATRRNPYVKAYGGEGTITIETNGSISYYYGITGADSGSSGSTYQGFNTGPILNVNEWAHIAIVRDLTNMELFWYLMDL